MTPLLREVDSVFPGENWFFYWKTSSSLWKSKLEGLSSRIVLCPLNWSFHHNGTDEVDFLGMNPEANLKKLVSILKELGKEAIFLLPLGPAPFLPNGGVPHLLARITSVNKDRAVYGVADSESRINKMYSFFDNRIFLGFSNFVSKLGEFFDKEKIEASIYGIESYYFEEQEVRDYMVDTSRVFDEAFSRYLMEEKNRQLIHQLKEHKNLAPEDLQNMAKDDFLSSIKGLYLSCAEEALQGFWEKSLSYIFVGGGHSDLLSRVFDFDQSESYSSCVFESMMRGFIPSSVLLPDKMKKEIVKRQFQDIVENCFNLKNFQKDYCEGEESPNFFPSHIFEFYHSFKAEKKWDHLGVLPFLKKNYPFTYKMEGEEKLNFSEEKNYSDKIIFICGSTLNPKKLNILFKIFMNGGTVILDISQIDVSISKSIEIFILENKLTSEKINFKCSLEYIVLGEGRFLTFEGENLKPLSPSSLNSFWNRILDVFDLNFLKFKGIEDLLLFWKKKNANSSDLNYDEIRRLYIYNPTSYKKKLKILIERNFSLIKVLNEIQSSVETNPYQIEIKVLPGGSLSLDFGVFS